MSATQIRAASREQRDPLVVDERAVLDRPDAGSDRDLDPLGPVGMGRDEDAVGRRLLDRGADCRLVQLDDVGPRAAGEDGAGDDQLDQVGAASDQLADLLPRLRG